MQCKYMVHSNTKPNLSAMSSVRASLARMQLHRCNVCDNPATATTYTPNTHQPHGQINSNLILYIMRGVSSATRHRTQTVVQNAPKNVYVHKLVHCTRVHT